MHLLYLVVNLIIWVHSIC